MIHCVWAKGGLEISIVHRFTFISVNTREHYVVCCRNYILAFVQVTEIKLTGSCLLRPHEVAFQWNSVRNHRSAESMTFYLCCRKLLEEYHF